MTDRELIAKLTEALTSLTKRVVGAGWHSSTYLEAQLALALARQHKGGWKHLDRDEEKPEAFQTVIIWDHESKSFVGTMFMVDGTFFKYPSAKWWLIGLTPPQD